MIDSYIIYCDDTKRDIRGTPNFMVYLAGMYNQGYKVAYKQTTTAGNYHYILLVKEK